MDQELEKYLPVILSSLTVVVLGCWNPSFLQEGGKANCLWLGLLGLLVGALYIYFVQSGKMKKLY